MFMLSLWCNRFSIEFKAAIVISFQSKLSKLHKKSDLITLGRCRSLVRFVIIYQSSLWSITFIMLPKTCFWLTISSLWTFSWQWKHYHLSWLGQSKKIFLYNFRNMTWFQFVNRYLALLRQYFRYLVILSLM